MDQKSPAVPDPFVHHPSLRGLITDPLTSFFRDFNACTYFASRPELREQMSMLSSDEAREANRIQTLQTLDPGDLWVFAYGSLMWDPAFLFSEVRRARLPGYSRQFILKDAFGARGNADRPGLMAALDRGAGCDGLLFRIEAAHVEAETEILWRRELAGPAYKPAMVEALADGGPYRALTFVADHEADVIETGLTRDEQIEYIATGNGFLGSSLEYLTNIARHLEILGIQDDEISALVDEVARYRSAL